MEDDIIDGEVFLSVPVNVSINNNNNEIINI